MINKHRKLMGYTFIAPFVIVFLVFNAYPILYSLYLSFTNWDGFTDITFAGFDNYTRLFTSKFFFQSVLNTLVIWILSIIPQLTFAFIIALILNTGWIKGRSAFRSFFYFPNLVTPITIGVTFSLLFGYPGGAVNNLLLALNAIAGPIDWASNPFLAKVIIAITICWQNFGYNIIFFGAGLAAIPKMYYEAAAIDGASPFKITTNITVPLMKPILIYVMITSIIGGLQIFDVAYMFKANGNADNFKTMIYYMYEAAFSNSQFGYSAAASYVIFLIISVFSLISYFATKDKEQREKK